MPTLRRAARTVAAAWVLAVAVGVAPPAASGQQGDATTTVVPAPSETVPADGLAPSNGVPAPTATTVVEREPGDEGLDAEETVRIVIVGLVAVALGLTAATWWYVRATRPVLPE